MLRHVDAVFMRIVNLNEEIELRRLADKGNAADVDSARLDDFHGRVLELAVENGGELRTRRIICSPRSHEPGNDKRRDEGKDDFAADACHWACPAGAQGKDYVSSR